MYKFMHGLSRFTAYTGGVVLLALIVLTCISVIGRSLNSVLHGSFFETYAPDFARWAIDTGIGPVNGDFELIEAGVAFAIFAFLPLCQITGSHASVDVFTEKLSPPAKRILQWIIDTVFALVLLLIAIQLYSGMQSKIRSGQTTLLLEFPVWWGYAICLLGAVVAASVGLYIAVIRAAELFGSKQILPSTQSH